MMAVWAAGATGAAGGAVVSGVLRRGGYRLVSDEPRLRLERAVWLVPTLAAVFAVLTWATETRQLLPAALLFALGGGVMVWIDLDVHRIPTAVVGSTGLLVALTGWAGAAAIGQPSRIGTSLAAAAVLSVGYFLLAYFGNLGLADVRLGAVAGLLLGLHGWTTVVYGTLAALLLGGVGAVVLLLAGRGRTSDMAYGPVIVLGALVAVGAAQ